MNEELRKILDDARAKGMSIDQLKGIVQRYNAKNNTSQTPTDTPKVVEQKVVETKPTNTPTKNPFEPTRSVNQVGQNITEGISGEPTQAPYFSKTNQKLKEVEAKKANIDNIAKEELLKKEYIQLGTGNARVQGKEFVFNNDEFNQFKQEQSKPKNTVETILDQAFTGVGNLVENTVTGLAGFVGAKRDVPIQVQEQETIIAPIMNEKSMVDSEYNKLQSTLKGNNKALEVQKATGKNIVDVTLDELIPKTESDTKFESTKLAEFKKSSADALNTIYGRMNYVFNENEDKFNALDNLDEKIKTTQDETERNTLINEYNTIVNEPSIKEYFALQSKYKGFQDEIGNRLKTDFASATKDIEDNKSNFLFNKIVENTGGKLAAGILSAPYRAIMALGGDEEEAKKQFRGSLDVSQGIQDYLEQNSKFTDKYDTPSFYNQTNYKGYKLLVDENGNAYSLRDENLKEVNDEKGILSEWNNLEKKTKVENTFNPYSTLATTSQVVADMAPLFAGGYITQGSRAAATLLGGATIVAQTQNDIYDSVKDRTDLNEREKNAYAMAFSTSLAGLNMAVAPKFELNLLGATSNAEKSVLKKIITDNAVKYASGEITAMQVAKEYAKYFVKNASKEAVQEVAEEWLYEPLVQNTVTDITNKATGSNIEMQKIDANSMKDVLLPTVLATGLMSGLSSYRGKNELQLEALNDAVNNVDRFNLITDNLVANGGMDEVKATETKKIVSKIANTIEQANVTDETDKRNLTNLLFQNETIRVRMDGNISDELKSVYKKQIADNQALVDKIISNQPIPTETLQEAKLEVAPTPTTTQNVQVQEPSIASQKDITILEKKIELAKTLGEDTSDLEKQLKEKQDAVQEQISTKIVLPTQQLELGLSEVEQGNQEPKVATEQSSQTEEEVKVEEVTQSESNPALRDVITPEGFTNRVFESNMQLEDENQIKPHISEEGYNYRVLSQKEIDAIRESGGVFPREGKQKGGNTNTKYWTKGNNKNWYGDKAELETIRVNQSNFSKNEVVKAENVEVYNKETGKFEPLVKPQENVSIINEGNKSETIDNTSKTTSEKAVTPTAPKELTLEQKKHNRIADLVKSFNGLTDRQKSGADGSNTRQQIIKLSSELGYTMANDGKKIKVTNDKGKEVKKIGLKEEKPLSSQDDIDYAMSEIGKGRFDWNGDSGQFRVNLGIPWSDIRQGVKDLQNGKPNSLPAKRLVEALAKNKEQGGYEIVAGSGALMVKEFVPFDQLDLTYELSADEEKQILENQAQLEQEANEYFNSLTEEEQIQILEANGQEITDTRSVEQSAASAESETNVSDKKSAEEPSSQEVKEQLASSKNPALRDVKSKKPNKLRPISKEETLTSKDYWDKAAKRGLDDGNAVQDKINKVWTKKYEELKDAKETDEFLKTDKTYQELLKEREAHNKWRDDHYHAIEIRDGLKGGFYENAILKGEITAKEANDIIESAGLEVPKNILEQVKSESLQSTKQTQPTLEQVNSEIGVLNSLISKAEKELSKLKDALSNNLKENQIDAFAGAKAQSMFNDKGEQQAIVDSKENELKTLKDQLASLKETKQRLEDSVNQNPLFQTKKKGKFETISKENFQKLIGKLKKAFPKINVNLISNDKTIEVLSKGGVDILKTKTGTIYGFVKDGEIYINEDAGLNANTPIHEFSHVWVQTMKAQFPNTYKNIIEKIKQEKSLIEQKRKDPNYSKLSDDALADEVLAEMVGNKGEKDFLDGLKGAKKTLIQQVLKSVSDVWKRIKDILTSQSPNIKKWTNEQFQNATIEDIVNNVTADLLGGREVGREEKLAKGVTLMTLPNGEKVKVKNVNSEVVNGFYSNTENALAQVKQDKMSGNQWVTQLLSRGANKEEMKWTTLSDFLEQNKDKSISKSDIQQYLKENRIQVVEVVKGSYSSQVEALYKELEAKNNGRDFDDWKTEDQDEWMAKRGEPQDTKFSQYQLEGEKENYKEVLVTMPSKVPNYTPITVLPSGYDITFDSRNNTYAVIEENQTSGKSITGRYHNTQEDAVKNAIEVINYQRKNVITGKAFDNQFKSSHFDEPNILVHLRMNTRTDADGNKVLFLEEVQSDWGQTGKREGFNEPLKIEIIEVKNNRIVSKDGKVLLNTFSDSEIQDWQIERASKESGISKQDLKTDKSISYKATVDGKKVAGNHLTKEDARKNAIEDASKIGKSTIPSAPFVTDTNAWTKLGLKTALKEAVAQGADKLAWTTGEQQNDRYDLSKSVDQISIAKQPNGNDYVVVGVKDNNIIVNRIAKESELEGIVGKEIASKAINEGQNVFKGKDLAVGGKGMKGFYGSSTEGSLGIVGNVAKSLFGQVPKTVSLTLPPIKGFFEPKEPMIGSTQHSIDITPELKAQVEEGQALFQIDSSNASKNDKETAIKNLVEKWKADGLSDTEIKNILSESETGKTFIDKLFPKEPKERSFSRTLEDMPTQVQNLVENKDYIPTTNPEQEAVADNFIKENGIEEATKILIDNKTSELSDAETNIVAMKLIKINNKNGNYKESARIFDEVAEKLTEAGRLIQTAALWNLMTEQGAVEYAMRLKSKGRIAQKEVVEQEVKTTKEKIIEIAREINGSKEIKDAIAKIYSKRERISKTKSQKAIDWLESIKVKDMAFTALPGVNLLPATYNTAINIIQTGIKANIMLNTAVAQAVKYIRENITADESFDESKFKKFILDNLPKIEDDAIKVAEQELGKKISDVVNAHYDIKEEYKKSLLDSILSKTDLTESEAKVIADIVETKFAQEADKKLDALEKKQKSQAKKVDDKIAKVESEIKAIENGTYKQDKKYPTTKSEKQKELDVLRKQKRELLGTEQPYVKIVDRINKGTISNADMKELLYSDIGLSNLDANTIAKIEEMHRKVKDAPQGSAEQRDRLADLLDFIDKEINGTDNWAIAKSLMYASLLSASSTQVKNFVSNTMQMTAEAYVNSMLMLAKGDAKGISGLAKGLLVGLERGGLEAIKVLKTGYDPNKKVLLLDSNPKISRKDVLESYTGNIKPISWAKYVRRLMVAADTLFYYGVKEMESYVLARQIALKSGLKGKALTDKINETLLKGESYYNEFKKQAIQEGYLDPKTQKRRIFELIEMNRDRSITDKADISALKATYNNDPVGALGTLSRGLQSLTNTITKANKPLGLAITSIIPFTRVISNVVNEQLNWTPLGYARALTEKGSIFSSPEQMKLTDEERSKLVIKATTGMLLAIGFLSYALKDDDDEDKIFDVTANGYGNSYKNTSLYPLGWKPYTIGIKMPNGKWVRYSYQNTPFGQLLGMIGTIADSKKYNKDADMTDRVGLFASTTANQMFSASALQGASTLFDALGSKDSDNMNKILELAISKAKMPIPNIAKEAYNIFDNQLYDKSDIKGMVINNVPVFQLLGRPKLNVFGEPIKKSRYGALLLLPETDNTLKSLYEVGVVPTIPLKNKKIYGEEMTNEQFYDYVETRGKYLRKITEEKLSYITSFTDKREAKSKYSDIEQQATKEAEDIIYKRYFKK